MEALVYRAAFDIRQWVAAKVWRLANWLQPKEYPSCKAGKLVVFARRDALVMGRPTFSVESSRASISLGRIEFRNQWSEMAFYPDSRDGQVMFNKQILAEIYAMMRTL